MRLSDSIVLFVVNYPTPSYAILMGKEGAYSDRNNDGVLNEGEETLILAKPCNISRYYGENLPKTVVIGMVSQHYLRQNVKN